MATPKTDFEMYAGDTRKLIVTVVDQDGIDVDLIGGSVTWQLAKSDWKKDPDASVLVTKTSGAGQIELADGSFIVNLQPADTAGFDGSYYHEAQVTLADGTVGTPLVGKVKVKPNLITPR